MSNRRDFLRASCGLACALAGISAVSLFESCTPVKYISADEVNGILSINKNEMYQQTFIVIRSRSLAFPVYLSKNNEAEKSTYAALLMKCTHKQCELMPAGNVLSCPCHGSEFSRSGKVLKEPANTDLYLFETTTDDQNIYIHLK